MKPSIVHPVPAHTGQVITIDMTVQEPPYFRLGVASCALIPYHHNLDLQPGGQARTITMMAESDAPDNLASMTTGPELAFSKRYSTRLGPHQKPTPPTR
ncbi:hypothetical protein GW742_24410 [Citrobacter freundii]|uniref:Uncharacterized protein n=1 Tax=Citrobacter meridianamericanus TaxID=2894201 RepID=A0ABT1B6N5_9ENTR|nr:hypothetical protein [Citrobacter meridianamericanus]MBC6504567.1 hypothetical protein [Citrobacter freundii]MBC6509342.1 hypothetical protein [Citrobacter freundii]MCO5781258.1 hypothetical protein [Citrobacter meridianamericanus]